MKLGPLSDHIAASMLVIAGARDNKRMSYIRCTL
jgi:hypothetical protein